MWQRLKGGGATPSQADEASPMDEPEKLELLSAMNILQDLPEEEIEALMSEIPIHTAKKGTIFYGSDGPEVLFLLKSGKVELYRLSPEGKRLTLVIVEQGTIFGEMSLIGQRLVGTCAIALEDSVICALSRHDVESLMVQHPQVALRVIEVLANRLQETRNSLEQMAFSDVTGRVADLLLRLSDGDDNVVEGYSHQDLAAMIGCLRESFTAVLDRFKGSGVLTTGRKRIEITDRAQLQTVVSQRTGPPA